MDDEKKHLRRSLSKQRQSLSTADRNKASQQASDCLSQQWLYQRSQRLAFYSPIKGELSPIPALKTAFKQHKQCYLPILDPLQPHIMHFGRYQPKSSTSYNRLGIIEPQLGHAAIAPAWTLDAVIVPLLAFDHQGYRLGWGGGFYDSTFSFVRNGPNQPRPWLIGFAYAWQQVEALPHSSHDISLDLVVTNNGTIDFERQHAT